MTALSRAYIDDGAWKSFDINHKMGLYDDTLDILARTRTDLRQTLKQLKVATSKRKLTLTPHTVEALQRIANALGHGAIEHRFNRVFTRAIGGKITPEQASDIWRLFGEEAHNVADYSKAVAGLNRIGIPFTARTVVEPGRASQAEIRLIATGRSEAGDTFFMPQQIAQRLESTMPNVIKDSAQRFAKARGDVSEAMGAVRDYNSLWKTSVVTGIFNPQGRYWWNNFVGDLSQIWWEDGLHQALRTNSELIHTLSLNTMGTVYTGVEKAATRLGKNYTYFPKAIGDGLARNRAHHVAKYGEDGALGSVYNALFNPVANRIWRGEKGVLRNKYGMEWSYTELRKMMQDEGVLDTMVNAELMESYYRMTPNWYANMGVIGKVSEAAKTTREGITDFASFVQQRQRGNFFLDLVRQGHSPSEAAVKVRKALYDWKHGVSSGEVQLISSLSPFYRFFKLAAKQVAGKILEPLIRPDKAMIDAMMGKSGFSRVQQQWAANQGWGEFWDPSGYQAYADSQEQWDAMARYKRPSWARTRAVTAVRRNSPEEVSRLRDEKRGIQEYSMMVMPPQTSLDLVEMMGSIIQALFVSVTPSSMMPWGAEMTPDIEKRVFSPALDILFPYIADPLQQMLRSMGADAGGWATGTRMRISPAEEILYGRMGGMGTYAAGGGGFAAGAALGFGRSRGGPVSRAVQTIGTGMAGAGGAALFAAGAEDAIQPHAEHGYPTAPAMLVTFGRLTPLLGTELPGLLDDTFFKNTAAQKAWRNDKSSFGDLFEAFATFFGRNTAMWKKHPFIPAEQAKYRGKDVMKQVKERMKEEKLETVAPERFYEKEPGE